MKVRKKRVVLRLTDEEIVCIEASLAVFNETLIKTQAEALLDRKEELYKVLETTKLSVISVAKQLLREKKVKRWF